MATAADAELVLIRADRAWEPAPQAISLLECGEPPMPKEQRVRPEAVTTCSVEESGGDDVLNLEGNFEMRGPDWRLTADSAQVYGSVEDPERLVIMGAPARMSLIRRNGERASGTGQRITYWRRRELVEVHGDAAFAAGNLAVTSSRIIYDLDEERLKSLGNDGVTFVVREGDDN